MDKSPQITLMVIEALLFLLVVTGLILMRVVQKNRYAFLMASTRFAIHRSVITGTLVRLKIHQRDED